VTRRAIEREKERGSEQKKEIGRCFAIPGRRLRAFAPRAACLRCWLGWGVGDGYGGTWVLESEERRGRKTGGTKKEGGKGQSGLLSELFR
jgi:hypothetical protein